MMKHVIIGGHTQLNDNFVSWLSIEPYFPHREVRPIQKNLIRLILTAIIKGRTDIVLQAPTGIGKSAIAATIAEYFKAQGEKSLFYLPRKGLIDQYMKDYPQYAKIKGGNEYPCLLDRDRLEKDFGIKVPKCTRDQAPCSIQSISCRHKPFGDRGGSGMKGHAPSYSRGELFVEEKPCPFWKDKLDVLNKPIAFVSSLYGYREKASINDIGPVKILVLDEADHVEKDILSMETLRITEKELDEFSGKVIPLEGNEPKVWIPILDMLVKGTEEKINILEEKIKKAEDRGAKDRIRLNHMRQRLNFAEGRHKEYKRHFKNLKEREDEYVVEFGTEIRSTGEIIKHVELKPAFISYCAMKHLSRGKHRIHMSATILNPLIYAQNLGIKDYLYIEVPESPFPVKNRKIHCHRIGKLNASNIKNLMSEINTKTEAIIKEGNGRSGLVIPTSHVLREQIYREQYKKFKPSLGDGFDGHDYVRCPICKAKLWQLFPHVEQYHDLNIFQFRRLHPYQPIFAEKARIITNASDSIERKMAMDLFTTSSSPKIWISTYPREGFDGIDDLVRLIIIPKIFYPYLGDPLVQKRKELQPSSYILEALRTLIQASGRGNRHQDDWCDIHILDENIDSLIKSARSMTRKLRETFPNVNVVPPWWEEAIVDVKS
jgi:Rad3-related DNA helicase